MRSQVSMSSSARAVRGSAVMISDSLVLAGSFCLSTRRLRMSRSVTTPTTFLSASTMITDPKFFAAIWATASLTQSSPPMVSGGSLRENSGLSRRRRPSRAAVCPVWVAAVASVAMGVLPAACHGGTPSATCRRAKRRACRRAVQDRRLRRGSNPICLMTQGRC